MSTLLNYKCPNCGGKIEFDSLSQNMKCPFCDTEFDVETLKSYDDELKGEQADDLKWENQANNQWQQGEAEEIRVYVCDSCGGEIVTDENTAATSCPYCDNPVIMKGNLASDLKPDYVIPFKLDKKAAKEAFCRHLKGKRLLPKVFKDENHIDEIKGIYVPFWLFNADANANMRFRATKLRSWSDSKYIYTETSYFSVTRGGNISFERVPVDGSTKMPDDLMESIEPYNFNEAVDFQTAYLSGYLADKYDVTADMSINRANGRIKHSAENAFASTVTGYNSVVVENSSVQLSNSESKYALLPVWILNTTWNGSKYTFAMNGQTGKFVGNLPLDKKAYWRWFGALSGIIGTGLFVLLSLIWLIL